MWPGRPGSAHAVLCMDGEAMPSGIVRQQPTPSHMGGGRGAICDIHKAIGDIIGRRRDASRGREEGQGERRRQRWAERDEVVRSRKVVRRGRKGEAERQ